MELQDIAAISERMLWVSFLVSMPMLVTSLVVGVLISIVQTVTGVQEMTLTFVPKIAAMLVVFALTLPWVTQVMVEFTEYVFQMFAGQY